MNESNFEAQHQAALETESARVAEEKLERIMDGEFRAFAVRFVNQAEYEGLITEGRFKGGPSYAPLLKLDGDPETAPIFSQYIKECVENGWDKVIRTETDWPQGTMSVSMYEHMLELLRQARQQIKLAGPDVTNYQDRVIGKMRELIQTETVREINYRIGAQSEYDLYDRRYDMFILALQLPQIHREMSADIETVKTLIGEESWQEIAPLIDSGTKNEHRNVGRKLLPSSIYEKIRGLALENSVEQRVYDTLSQYYNDRATMEMYGGEPSVELVRQWLDNPARVDLRAVINTVISGQMTEYEERQYELALVISLDADKHSSRTPDFRAWFGIEPGRSAAELLGAISILPGKEVLNSTIEVARRSGSAAHPVFDNRGKIRFPVSDKK
jgi:hypothetical protein